MAERTTLNSKLRVLVARTFRAEKLYASMRNVSHVRTSNVANVIEVANDLRAKEWQGSHVHLRSALSDMLSLGNTKVSVQKLEELLCNFQSKAIESTNELGTKTEQLLESVRRQEFSNVLKLSIELICLKARAQANKAVVDELSSLIPISHQSRGYRNLATQGQTPFQRSLNRASFGGLEPGVVREQVTVVDNQGGIQAVTLRDTSNVIPIKRRASFNR